MSQPVALPLTRSRTVGDDADSGRWRVLVLLSVVEVLALSVWFSASAVIPALESQRGSRTAMPPG
jgi:hypothetical protein